MAPSPTKKDKRKSLLDQFPDLNIGSASSGTGYTSTNQDIPSLSGSFSRGWPPASMRSRETSPVSSSSNLPYTLRMSQDYRFYDDHWRLDPSNKDDPADVSEEFKASEAIMTELAGLLSSQKILPEDIERLIVEDMAVSIFGSNKIERLGLGLDETYKLCLEVFRGDQDLDFPDRSQAYQAKLDRFVLKNTNPGEKAVIRNRKEVVQHAAAFQHLVKAFVKEDRPMSEALIKETHDILVRGLSAEDAGVISNKDFGGTYRKHDAYVGALKFLKPSDIPKAMKSLIDNLQADLNTIEETGVIDPFMLASKYSDRFVNVHPFKDGNGRMCRMVLNAILIKYAGIVVVLGEKDQDREQYIMIAHESAMVKGHPGQLGKLVLDRAGDTLKKLRNKLTKRK